MEITFKKVFGMTTMSIFDTGRLLLHLQQENFEVAQDGIIYRVSRGEFGASSDERRVLSELLEPAEREDYLENGQSVPTLDVAFEKPGPFRADITYGRTQFETWLSGLVPAALQAVNRVMNASRDLAFETQANRSDEMLRNIVEFNRRFKYTEFKRYLFYKTPSGRYNMGFIGEVQTYTVQSWSNEELSRIQRMISAPDKQIGFLLRAVEDFVDEDYGSSILNSAVACELLIHEFIRKKLKSTHRISDSQTDRFLEQTSNRLLLPVVLGFTTNIDANLLEGCRALFDLRNAIAHGKKSVVSRQEARSSLEDAENLVRTLRGLSLST